jgi:DNA-binding PadR family transcriptional regulator
MELYNMTNRSVKLKNAIAIPPGHQRSPAALSGAAQLNATAASVLGFLQRGPMSGYELASQIEAIIGNFWNITTSQVYRELRSLEAAGLVGIGKAGVRERRLCTITAAGRTAFKEWIARDPGDPLVRDPFLLAVFFHDALDDQTLGRFVRHERAKHERRLAAFQQASARMKQSGAPPDYVLRFATMFTHMRLEWLDALPWK